MATSGRKTDPSAGLVEEENSQMDFLPSFADINSFSQVQTTASVINNLNNPVTHVKVNSIATWDYRAIIPVKWDASCLIGLLFRSTSCTNNI